MNWGQGYSASYYLTIVDPNTWIDTTQVEITGGSIKRSDGDLIESADIDTVDYLLDNERIIRVWLDARQNGGLSHTPLFTGYAASPNQSRTGTLVNTSISCYSVLKPAQDVLLPHGWYAPVDTNGEDLVKQLLKVCKAPVRVECLPKRLSEPIIAESGESNLSMTWLIMNALGWTIRINGLGEITVTEYSSYSKENFGINMNDVLEQEVSIEYDWYECPNVFRATANGYSAIVKDESDASPFSISSRGREIWAEEEDCDLAEGDDLTSYAAKRLKELQSVVKKVSYDRRFFPDLTIGDVVVLDYPEQALTGEYEIISQTITLGPNAKTSEEVQAI